MILPIGHTLQGGKYKIMRFISKGGFGCTYEALYTELNLHVAIKEFFVSSFCNRDENNMVYVTNYTNAATFDRLKDKFTEEANAIFNMKHPNIVHVTDMFEENGTAYYVMDYIEGRSLFQIVRDHGALPYNEAENYIRQIADALKYVHSLNRLHLDIKPANIMLNRYGQAILIDFGASKHYDEESGENTSSLLGINTKGYAPVEQMAMNFSNFNPATDIYALGATFYKLITGITPPDSLTLVSEVQKVKPLPRNVPNGIRKTIRKSMKIKRHERFQSIDEFLCCLNGDFPDSDEVPVIGIAYVPHRDNNSNNASTFKPLPPETLQEYGTIEPEDSEEVKDLFSDLKKTVLILSLIFAVGFLIYLFLTNKI